MKNRFLIIFTTASILFLILILPALMIIPIKMIPANDQPGYGDKGRVSIYGIRTFTQEFISKNNNLMAVGATIKNPNLKNQKDVIFNLYNSSGNLIRTSKLNGFNIGDGDFVKIVFDPVPDSSQKKFSFTLSSPNANEEEVLELFLIGSTDSILTYTYNAETKSGGTPMVTFHKPVNKLDTIKQVYLNLFSKL